MNKKKKRIIVISIAGIALLLIATILCAILFAPKAEHPQYDDPFEHNRYGLLMESDDWDGDGLKNDKEIRMGTHQRNADTDEDGLSDYYEVTFSMTSPTNADSDMDGLYDGIELAAGLDPNNAVTDGKTADRKRQFSDSYRKDGITVSLSGTANIYSTYCGAFELPGLTQTPGVISQAIEVAALNSSTQATVTFPYSKSVISRLGIEPEDLSICEFTADGKFEPIRSTVDADSRTVTAQLRNSGKYLLCDSRAVNARHELKIMLLIDNSGSMFPKELCATSDENDVDFKRLDMAKAIIRNIPEAKYGLAKFTGTYSPLCDIGTAPDTIADRLDQIREQEEIFNGTYISTSIIEAVDAFNNCSASDRKFIVLLTDGETTEFASRLNTAITAAQENNIVVIAVGLGHSVDTNYLQKLTTNTGGSYVVANNDTALEGVYAAIRESLSYSANDLDGDGTNDAFLVADTGFRMDRNAFNFENFCAIVPEGSIRQNGVCYGMVYLAQTFYLGDPITDGTAFQGENSGNTYRFGEFDISDILSRVKNLRDLDCEVLEQLTQIYQTPVKDRFILSNGVLRLNRDIVPGQWSKYLTTRFVDSSGKWNGEDYRRYEQPFVDIQSYLEGNEQQDDMDIVVALYWLWGTQMNDDYFSANEFTIQNDWTGSGNEGDLETLTDKMRNGIPLGVSYTTNAGGHIINAMRLLRDINDPSTYYLECYDNNDAEKPVLLKITKTNMDLWSALSISNWGKNHSVRPYIKQDGKWVAISLTFGEAA